jgi:endonuclease/exonuclease/phosphatase family metal-dependent hydrolase
LGIDLVPTTTRPLRLRAEFFSLGLDIRETYQRRIVLQKDSLLKHASKSALTWRASGTITSPMNPCARVGRLPVSCLILLLCAVFCRGEGFRVASYNVESYLDQPTETRSAKLAAAKAKVCESILALKPDVIALQEMGRTNAVLELRDSLKAGGLDLPYWEYVNGFDTNIHIAILSRFPFIGCRHHTNESFLLSGRRFRVSRGFGELDIRVNTNFSFTLIAAHLKSKRAIAQADEAEMRLEEAKLLREKIDDHFAADPNAEFVVLGDFNDSKDSPVIKAVLGRGKHKLVDTRPAERNGENASGREPRDITWTHYYAQEDSYWRVDYIFLSPAMARKWVTRQTYVLSLPDWGVGSDHRPIVAAFEADGH